MIISSDSSSELGVVQDGIEGNKGPDHLVHLLLKVHGGPVALSPTPRCGGRFLRWLQLQATCTSRVKRLKNVPVSQQHPHTSTGLTVWLNPGNLTHYFRLPWSGMVPHLYRQVWPHGLPRRQKSGLQVVSFIKIPFGSSCSHRVFGACSSEKWSDQYMAVASNYNSQDSRRAPLGSMSSLESDLPLVAGRELYSPTLIRQRGKISQE